MARQMRRMQICEVAAVQGRTFGTNLALCLPLPENRALLDDLDVTAQVAEHAAITKALTDTLAEQSGDLLVFFWGGHG